MPCALCSATSTPGLTPRDRVCAFDVAGNFVPTSRHCQTAAALKAACYYSVAAHQDRGSDTSRLATVGHEGSFLLLLWHDHLPELSKALLLHPEHAERPVPITLQLAEAVLSARQKGKR